MSLLALKQVSSLLILVKLNWQFFIPLLKSFMPTEFPELFVDGITLKSEKVTKFLEVFID